jgi:hypothetical protein
MVGLLTRSAPSGGCTLLDDQERWGSFGSGYIRTQWPRFRMSILVGWVRGQVGTFPSWRRPSWRSTSRCRRSGPTLLHSTQGHVRTDAAFLFHDSVQPRGAGPDGSAPFASFLSLAHSLSGNATPLQKLQIRAWTPSNCQVPWQVGSSRKFNRVLSWMHPACGRFRLKRVPSQRYVPTPDSAEFNGTVGPRYPSTGSLSCTTGVPGLRAVVRCSQGPRWGQTKQMYYYYYYCYPNRSERDTRSRETR